MNTNSCDNTLQSSGIPTPPVDRLPPDTSENPPSMPRQAASLPVPAPDYSQIPPVHVFATADPSGAAGVQMPPDLAADLQEIRDPAVPADRMSAIAWRLAPKLGCKDELNRRMSSGDSPMEAFREWKGGEGMAVLVDQIEPGAEFQLDMPALLHILHECRNQPFNNLHMRNEARDAIRCLWSRQQAQARVPPEPQAQQAVAPQPPVPADVAMDAAGAGAGAAAESSWQEKKQALEQQLGPRFVQFSSIGALFMNSIVTKSAERGPSQDDVKKIRQDCAFFSLAALHFEHAAPASRGLRTTFMEMLDDQIRSDGGRLPTLPTHEVMVLLDKVMMGYLNDVQLNVHFDTQPESYRPRGSDDRGLNEIKFALLYANAFLKARLTQLPPEDAHLAPQIQAQYEARIHAFATDRVKRWLATVPPDFKPDSISQRQRQNLGPLRDYLHLIDRHQPAQAGTEADTDAQAPLLQSLLHAFNTQVLPKH